MYEGNGVKVHYKTVQRCDGRHASSLAEDGIDRVIQELFPRRQVRLGETSHDSLACGSGIHIISSTVPHRTSFNTHFFVTVIKSCVLR